MRSWFVKAFRDIRLQLPGSFAKKTTNVCAQVYRDKHVRNLSSLFGPNNSYLYDAQFWRINVKIRKQVPYGKKKSCELEKSTMWLDYLEEECFKTTLVDLPSPPPHPNDTTFLSGSWTIEPTSCCPLLLVVDVSKINDSKCFNGPNESQDVCLYCTVVSSTLLQARHHGSDCSRMRRQQMRYGTE